MTLHGDQRWKHTIPVRATCIKIHIVIIPYTYMVAAVINLVSWPCSTSNLFRPCAKYPSCIILILVLQLASPLPRCHPQFITIAWRSKMINIQSLFRPVTAWQRRDMSCTLYWWSTRIISTPVSMSVSYIILLCTILCGDQTINFQQQ